MNLKRKMRKGFTLVELVVVIAVIAVLAAVSVGAYFGVTDSANSSNATAAQKQVKDIWLLYSVNEYDPSNSDAETGDDFCNDYIPYNGFTTYVNYKVVKFYDNPSYQAENQETIKRDGILFKIETDYPTRILVEDDRIVSESTVLKNENDFVTSLTSGKYIIEGCGSLDDFVLTTLVDSEGNEVRGSQYIRYDVVTNRDPTITTSYYGLVSKVEGELKGQSLYSIDRLLFDPSLRTGVSSSDSSIQLEDEIEWIMEEKVDESNYKSFNTTEDVKDIKNVIIDKVEKDDVLNGYVTKVITLRQTFTDTDQTFDINEYPVITFIQGAQTSIFGYKSLDSLNGTTKLSNGDSVEKLPAVGNSFNKDNHNTYNLIFVFGDNAKLTDKLIIPEGYILVVDFNEFDSSKTVSENIAVSRKYLNNLNKDGFNETDSIRGTDSIEAAGSDYVDYLYASGTYNAPANPHYTFLSTDEGYVNLETGEVDESKTPALYKEINKLTIGKGATLNISTGAHMFVESIVTFPTGGMGSGVLQHGAVYIDGDVNESGEYVNQGKINLGYNCQSSSDPTSYLRTLGKIYGNGVIKTSQTTKVIDFFKASAFMGGTRTKYYYEAKLFPFYSYTFDNIQANLEMVYGATYQFISGVYSNNQNYYIPAFDVIAPNVAGKKALVLMDEDSVFVKRARGFRNMFNFVSGSFKFGSFSLSLEGMTIDTGEYQFPLSNIDLVINENVTVVIHTENPEKPFRFAIMPTSKIINHGNISITGGSEIVVLNFNDEQTIDFMNKISQQKAQTLKQENVKILEIFRYDLYENYENNAFLIQSFRYFNANNFNTHNFDNYGQITVDNNSHLNSLNNLNNYTEEEKISINCSGLLKFEYGKYYVTESVSGFETYILFKGWVPTDDAETILNAIGKLSGNTLKDNIEVPVAIFTQA